MPGQPKAPFYIALFAVVLGLVGFAVYRSDLFAPKGQKPGGGPMQLPSGPAVEEPSGTAAVTTVKEYKFHPSERLPAVKGTSAYKPLVNNTVRFSLNVWAG